MIHGPAERRERPAAGQAGPAPEAAGTSHVPHSNADLIVGRLFGGVAAHSVNRLGLISLPG
jgi:hypothetical protein